MLRSVAISKPLDAQQLGALVNSMQIVTTQPGCSLLSNVPLDALYILQSGTMTVSIKNGPTATIRPGGVFGELALAEQQQSNDLVTATAATGATCVLARITRESFDKHVGGLQEIKDTSFNERALASVDALASLTIAERRQLARIMTRVSYEEHVADAQVNAPRAALSCCLWAARRGSMQCAHAGPYMYRHACRLTVTDTQRSSVLSRLTARLSSAARVFFSGRHAKSCRGDDRVLRGPRRRHPNVRVLRAATKQRQVPALVDVH